MKLKRTSGLAIALLLGLGGLSQANISRAGLPEAQQIALMRAKGPEAVATFLQAHNIASNRLPNPDVRAVLDELCQQRDCHASRLYWHTDLEQAKAAAQKTGKPILSLRMLGNLDEELSCANSRFFRVALYPNSEISQTLRDRFILHWSSERPVPKLTLDFGDGRKLERTVTGNSIHYVLDPQGKPIEAIPGLYSPQAFLQQLDQIDTAFQTYQKAPDNPAKANFWSDYHRDRLSQLQTKWASELKQVGIQQPPRLLEIASTDAETAGRVAMSKMVVEMPVVRQLRAASQNQAALTKITDEASWRKLADRSPARLDANSLALMQAKLDPKAAEKLPEMANKFQQTMALDTVRNEYNLHAQIHQWFMVGSSTQNFDSLNQWVYSQLFLTPKNDPWLGLNPQDAFAAIEGNGVIP
jgi:hypothetical protein